MSTNFDTVLTDIGAEKIAQAPISGEKIEIIDFAAGDGAGSYYRPEGNQTALKNEVYRGKINRYETKKNKITIYGIIPADVGGFTVREVGVFDVDGNLIAVANTAETEKPLPLDGITYEMEIGIKITINGNPDNLQIIVNSISYDQMRTMIAAAKKEIINTIVKPGVIVPYAGNGEPPGGYLLCDGTEVPRATYAGLFAAIGTTYGEGDGVNTFNLPDLTARFIEGGTTAGEIKEAGLPNITGEAGTCFDVTQGAALSGAFYSESTTGTLANSETTDFLAYHSLMDASRQNSIYGNSDTVQPPAVTMRYIIRY